MKTTLITILFLVGWTWSMPAAEIEQSRGKIYPYRSIEFGVSWLPGRANPGFYTYSSVKDSSQELRDGSSSDLDWILKGGSIDVAIYPIATALRFFPKYRPPDFVSNLGFEYSYAGYFSKQTDLTEPECEASKLFSSCSSQGNRLSLFSSGSQFFGLRTALWYWQPLENLPALIRLNLHGGISQNHGEIESKVGGLLSPRNLAASPNNITGWYAKISFSVILPFATQSLGGFDILVNIGFLFNSRMLDFDKTGITQINGDYAIPIGITMQF